MKIELLLQMLPVLALTTACATQPVYTEPSPLWGNAAPVTPAVRTIVIGPDTRWVNITGGETVNFKAGAKSFAWAFNGPSSGYHFDLKAVVAAGLLDHSVVAYVDPDITYMGGGH